MTTAIHHRRKGTQEVPLLAEALPEQLVLSFGHVVEVFENGRVLGGREVDLGLAS